MNRITVTFLHPINGSSVGVKIEDTLTAEEIVDELIAVNFIPERPSYGDYGLLIKSTQKEIRDLQTVASGGAVDNDVLRIIPVALWGERTPAQ